VRRDPARVSEGKRHGTRLLQHRLRVERGAALGGTPRLRQLPLWVDDVDESEVEDGKPGDAVGAVRRVRMGETEIRQRLLAHSDIERCYSYEFCDPGRYPVRDFRATIRVTPITDGDRAFVEWWASFDAAGDDREHWTQFFGNAFQGWLESLRRRLGA
jgi:hypothetical protein